MDHGSKRTEKRRPRNNSAAIMHALFWRPTIISFQSKSDRIHAPKQIPQRTVLRLQLDRSTIRIVRGHDEHRPSTASLRKTKKNLRCPLLLPKHAHEPTVRTPSGHAMLLRRPDCQFMALAVAKAAMSSLRPMMGQMLSDAWHIVGRVWHVWQNSQGWISQTKK